MGVFEIIQLLAFAAREAPEIINMFAALLSIFTPDSTDQRIEEARLKAVLTLDRALRDARRFVKNVEDLDFGEGENNRNARFFNVVHSVKERAKAIGEILDETGARTIAQTAVRMERAEGAIAIPEGEGA